MEGLQESANKAKSSFLGKLGFSAAITAVAHPLTYVKVLIQVGHEPLPPQATKTFFGRKVMRLPNFIQYAGHIKSVDGWFGLYRGLQPRILQNIVNTTVSNTVANRINECKETTENSKEPKSVQTFLAETGNAALIRTAGCVASYPFHVISVRMMVQFVGRETYYGGIVSSIREIYQQEGILGFFSGFIPYLIGELFTLWICRSAGYIFEEYVLDKKANEFEEVRGYFQGISKYIAGSLTYPFELVTNIMAVNDTRLAAGNPPLMLIYESWTECWSDLGRRGLRNRGASLFRRAVLST